MDNIKIAKIMGWKILENSCADCIVINKVLWELEHYLRSADGERDVRRKIQEICELKLFDFICRFEPIEKKYYIDTGFFVEILDKEDKVKFSTEKGKEIEVLVASLFYLDSILHGGGENE